MAPQFSISRQSRSMFPHSTMLKSSSLLCYLLTNTSPRFHSPIQSIPFPTRSRFKSRILSMESKAMSDVQEPLSKLQKLDTDHQNGKKGHKGTPPTVPLLLVKKLSDKAILPSRGSALAAGYDLSSAVACFVPARGKALVQTDLSIAIPQGTYARIAPRSGLAWKHSIDVGAGVIDADYRGPVGVILFNHSDQDFEIKAGDRIAQLILERIVTPDVEEVDDLEATCRGAGGFGSTGV